MGHNDFVTKEKRTKQIKTLAPGEVQGRENALKIFAFQNCSWKLSALPEGKLLMLPSQAAASTLNSN